MSYITVHDFRFFFLFDVKTREPENSDTFSLFLNGLKKHYIISFINVFWFMGGNHLTEIRSVKMGILNLSQTPKCEAFRIVI